MKTCNTNIIIPPLPLDECQGNKTTAACVTDVNVYSELGIEANSSQESINQAMYLAFITLKAKVDALQTIIDNL